MRIHRAILICSLAAAQLAGARPALADQASVFHVPPAETVANEPFRLEARIDRAWEATLHLRFRAIGATAWRDEVFQRGAAEGTYLATVPPDFVKPPGLEYYIVGTTKGGEARAHFATETDPHRVIVPQDSDAVLRQQELERVGGRRARVHVSGEWVDYGSRRIDPGTGETLIPDAYYRVDADFTYRLLRFPLYQMRFGFTRLLGQTPATVRDDGDCSAGPVDAEGTCQGQAGFAGSGWFEMRFRLTPVIDVDLRGIVAAGKTSFGVGGRVEMRAGPEDGSHVALGAESLPETGYDLFVRLGWDTVPHFPMAATVAITDYPASHRATAVRLIYDIAHPFEGGLRIGLRAGYQARDQGIGGVTLGGNAAFEF